VFLEPHELVAAGFEQASVKSGADVSDLLVTRSPVDGELVADQVHSYPLELSPGNFLRLDFYPSNLDLLVSLAWPGGRKTLEWTAPQRIPTPISWIADVAGTYQLKVRSLEDGHGPGVYRLQTKMLRQAVAHDPRQVAACRALSEATQLRRQWTRSSLINAISRYEQALSYWQAVADRPQEAATLKNMGDVFEILSEQQKALGCFQKSRALYSGLNFPLGQLKTSNAICASYNYRGEFQKALEICTQEMATVNDPWEKAQSLHNLGAAYYGTNDMQKAVGFLNDALRLREAIRDRSGQAETLLYLGYVSHAIKDTGEAEKYYQQSLELWRAAKNPRGLALTLTALGHVSNISGERQLAVSYYDQSLEIFRTIGELAGQSSVLEGMAYLYAALGEKEKALQYYLEALGLARRAKDVVAEGNTLDYISEIYRNLGDYGTALQYSQQAVMVNRSIPSILGESYALSNLGKVFQALGKEDSAMESYARALELSRKGGDRFLEGLLLNAFGHLHHASGRLSKALDYYEQAFSVQQKVNDSVRVPTTLYNLARAERDRGNLDRAIRYAEQALEISESLRGKVASRQLRGSFLASVHQQYELVIDLLMQQHMKRPSEGFDAAALQASERARARSLLDTLTEARLDIRQGIEPGLLAREQLLQRSLNAKAERQMRLLSGKREQTESAALRKEISELANEYDQVQGQIQSKSPRYAALTQPRPLSLEEIQRQVLQQDAILLEYALGEERSYLWAVTQTSQTTHELPKRAEIEKEARGVYELLIARQPNAGETTTQYRDRVAKADAQYRQKAASLSEMLLGPVAGLLGTRRLLIVAEGALQYLPFGALPEPMAGSEDQEPETVGDRRPKAADTDSVTPLIVHHEIVDLPSASVMAVLRREIQKRPTALKRVAVLADPVFESDDPRLRGISRRNDFGGAKKGQSGEKKAASVLPPYSKRSSLAAPSWSFDASGRQETMLAATDLQRALRDVNRLRDGLNIPRLLATRAEADAIMSVSPPESSMKAVGFEANRERATNPELGQYRIVHFATHGLLNTEHPELSGLVLSLFDEEGNPQDGFLRLHDIYNLNLPADLVVLSACNTGLGKEVRGEGLIGIVRGFMYAGAARVVASLWKVDDEATAELMKRFYRHMLEGDMPAAAALRAAQVELRQHKQWHSPYFWAGFVLQGEWR